MKIALEQLKASYKKAAEKLTKAEDPEKIIVETPFRTFKEIGNLFAQSFSLALEHAVNALDAFQESVGGIFR